MINNTEQSFSDKWHKNKSLAFEHTLNESSEIFKWIVERNGFKNAEGLKKFLENKKRVLDAGCGNGRVTALLRTYSDPSKTSVTGIDLVAAKVAEENLESFDNVYFRKMNLLEDLSSLGKFDFIYCQEVLHHTGDAPKAFSNLAALVEDGGEIAIYVYKKKAPAREYVDDYIRDSIAGMEYEEAMHHCRQLTELGRILSKASLTIQVPDVDLLSIPAGSYNVQRFLYYFFAKCFWNDEFSFEDNAVINYDWYHPQNCSRHTVEEVTGWFNQNGLTVNHSFEDFYGITVKGILHQY